MIDNIEDVLRDSLREHATQAPHGDFLAQRILAEVDRSHPVHGVRANRWRTWGLPVAAAASVLAVLALIVGLVSVAHQHSSVQPPAVSPTSSRKSAPASPTPSASGSATASVTNAQPIVGPVGGPVPTGLRLTDATFVNPSDGWALGSGDCLSGSGTCGAIVRTTDGGASWVGIPTPPGAVVGDSCSASTVCLSGLRFADRLTGYAFGPNSLYMTTDGGSTWRRQAGGALALETLDGNVIRLVDSGTGCPGPCNLAVEVAPVGGLTWTTEALLAAAPSDIAQVSLARTGGGSFVAIYPGSAANPQPITLWSTVGDTVAWVRHSDPCTAAASGSITESISAAPDGALAVECVTSAATATVITSTDGAEHFTAPRPAPADGEIGSASASTLFLAASDLYRSADGGQSWQRVLTDPSNGVVSAPEFQSATTGFIISHDGATIWMTTDAGLTWTPFTFH